MAALRLALFVGMILAAAAGVESIQFFKVKKARGDLGIAESDALKDSTKDPFARHLLGRKKGKGKGRGRGRGKGKACSCSKEKKPVCSRSGKEYDNACLARCDGVGKTFPCDSDPKPDPKPCYCPQYYDPVCGSDGETYGNKCEARCAGVKVVPCPECLCFVSPCEFATCPAHPDAECVEFGCCEAKFVKNGRTVKC